MNLFKYDSALKYGPTHVYRAQLNFIFVSHGKLLMFKSLKCKMFKGLSYMVQLTQGHGTHKRKTIQPKKENE